MNILFFHRWVGVHPGGTETHVKELAYRFSELGHRSTILTREGPRLQDAPKTVRILRISKNPQESDHSYEDWRLYWHTGLFMIKSFFLLLHLYLAGERFACISCHFVTESLVARSIRMLFGTPIMFILEGYTPWEAKEAQRANYAVAISEYEAKRCQGEFGFRPEVIHVGIDRDLFTPKRKSRIWRKTQFVLTVSRLEPRKDIPTLIRAAKILQHGSPQPHITIVGTGIAERSLQKLAKKERVGKTVTFLGYVSSADLRVLYQRASLFVLPTLEEGLGIVLLEAMSSGLPVVASRVGAVPEVVADAGILVPPKRPEALADAIHTLLQNRRHWQRLRTSALERVKLFDWQKIIRRYETAYERCIGG